MHKSNKEKLNKLINIALKYKESGDLLNAKINLKKAIVLDSKSFIALNNLGNIYSATNDQINAKRFFLKAINIKPDYSKAIFNLALLNQENGNLIEAGKLYKEAIKHDPYNLGIYHNLYRIEPSYFDEKKIILIKEIIETQKISTFSHASGLFILAYNEKNKKNYAEELKYLSLGHKHYYLAQKANNDKILFYWLQVAPKLINKIDIKNKVKKISQINPIFIIGMPRSGSTLVESIIVSGKKNIPVGGETGIFNRVFIKECRNLIFDRNFLLNDATIKINLDNLVDKIVKEYEKIELVKKECNYIFTDKSLENFFFLDIILQIFPKTKIINCERNIFHSIVSIFQNFLPKIIWSHSIENILDYTNNYINIIKILKNRYTGRIYNIKLDDLTNDSKDLSKKIFKFCELDWDAKSLEFYKRKDLTSKTASNMQIRNKIYKIDKDRYIHYKEFFKDYTNKYKWLKNIL